MSSKLEIGKTYNHLTAIREVKERRKGQIQWVFLCDCGKETVKPAAWVLSGNTKSCGCQKYSGILNHNDTQSKNNSIPIGTRFGKLVVVENLGQRRYYNGKRRRWYRCSCDCGNDKEAFGNCQQSGSVSSCGCVRSIGEEAITKLFIENGVDFEYNKSFLQQFEETGRKLRFDFIVYKNDKEIDRFIEFDGKQHEIGFSGGSWSHSESWNIIHERDMIKDEFCRSHGYPLVRIPYWKLNSQTIEDLLGDRYIRG